jgi:vacuolar-type H+-ATPase subunit I/STV1
MAHLQTSGVIIGAWVFVIIVIARKLCIWGEYHFTKKFWIFFLIAGLVSLILGLLTSDLILSVMFSSAGFIFLWGIHETIEQEERVKKGWFPKKERKTK